MDVVLGATLHDPVGRTAETVARLDPQLRALFPSIAVNVSDATRPEVLSAVRDLGGRVMTHAAAEANIGRFRRDAVAFAADGRHVLYVDFDHLMRWVEHGLDDLKRVLAVDPDVDMLVVGRSAAALAEGPRRLRETENLVNHAYALLTGEHWDLMFAVRRLSPAAADLVVSQSRVDTLANDVEWPLLARRAGLRLGYTASDALSYRTIEAFGAPADSGDEDALQWIRRLEFAALHASAMRPFLDDQMD
ncbi:hypothetical protein [Devosia sp. XK-2]|uniref:hypothetical protein n=1 Tax=Devosia sp. XK-2 TaxID=3126689 RepID=UPI0030D37193